MSENERREQILDAVERLLGRGGLTAVTMREVAAEAGVSVRLVQYYGKSKDELLTTALARLADKSVQRWRNRAGNCSREQSAIGWVTAFFDEALPTDDEGRTFHRIGVSLELLAVTESGAAAQAYRAHLRALADHLTEPVAAKSPLSTQEARPVALEVMALAHGLGTLLMAGQITEPVLRTLVDDYLDRLAARLSSGTTVMTRNAERECRRRRRP